MRLFPFLQVARWTTALLALLSWIGSSGSLYATHNLAGDITYNYLGNNEVEIIVTTYTDPSAFQVDRCEIDIEIWNSTGSNKLTDINDIPRENGPFRIDQLYPITCPNQHMGEYIFGSVKKNIYRTRHTFPGPGWYLVRFHDLARLENILNMFSSGSQEFFIETTLLINPYLGDENSPRFLNHPIDQACTDRVWTHNPGGWDPDGDSLNYRFVPCRQYDGSSIPTPIVCTAFIQPDQYANNGPMVMDPVTGLITWNTPKVAGIYNIAYVIEEFRDGVLIGRSFRDMAIFVNPCDNNPPVVVAITDTCVYAGDNLVIDFKIYDPDFNRNPPPGDSIYFYLNNNGQNNNGPFAVLSNPAQLVITEPTGLQIPPVFPIAYDDTIRGRITWATNCSHIRESFYQIDFYVHDNIGYFGDSMLSTNHIIKINVIPRPVTGLNAVVSNQVVGLNWDPHACNTATGYQIYRKIGGGGFAEDTVCCDSDPIRDGWRQIGTTTGWSNTSFQDGGNGSPFPYGENICYLVRAVFPEGVTTCVSNEACVEIIKDFPVIFKDSVLTTGGGNGEIRVAWSAPTEIDTNFFPRPYTYTLNRANGISGAAIWAPIATGIPFGDTTYLDQGRNTDSQGYRYRADIYDATNNLISEGNSTSSIYLEITPGDKQLRLEWREFVPWTNRIYDIYRADSPSGPLVYLTTLTGNGGTIHTYLDTGLENYEDYCYVVVSEGEYNVADMPDSVRNASQRACGIPVDLVPPCISNVLFDTLKDCISHVITFTWNEPDSACAADVDFYTVFRAENRGAPFTAIAQVDSGVNYYNVPGLSTIADCYGITATDTNGNESPMLIWCFENCPEVELGNVFTPNGDGVNDYFAPIQDRNIRFSLVQIYDRWGNVVYATTSVPDNLRIWDGNTSKGVKAPDGVYYYLIRYEEDRLPRYVPRPALIGNVTLLR
jgi:gliding motility-associated-like protein